MQLPTLKSTKPILLLLHVLLTASLETVPVIDALTAPARTGSTPYFFIPRKSSSSRRFRPVTILSASPQDSEAAAVQSTTSSAIPPSSTIAMKNNLRWAIHGIVTELIHNIFLRPFLKLRNNGSTTSSQRIFHAENTQQSKFKSQDAHNSRPGIRHPPKREIAVITGATGGIGSEIARDLAFRGYDILIAARDSRRGEELAKDIVDTLKEIPTTISMDQGEGEDNGEESNNNNVPLVKFVEYHADVPESASRVAAEVESLTKGNDATNCSARKLSILINNAGIMGKSKQLTMKVNLIGPAILTLALLPFMTVLQDEKNDDKNNADISSSVPMVINVGSSAHLRASSVFDGHANNNNSTSTEERSFIETLPDIPDSDLSTYAQSKLAIMQFSTVLRNYMVSKNDNNASNKQPIQIIDAHPGLVWTPLLRNHIGDAATNTLQKTGLAKLIYKSPEEGASAIVSAVDYIPELGGDTTGKMSKEQVYFVNGQPGGYAASESRDVEASMRLWKEVILPEVQGVVPLPEGWE